jgi:hypothetical protein
VFEQTSPSFALVIVLYSLGLRMARLFSIAPFSSDMMGPVGIERCEGGGAMDGRSWRCGRSSRRLVWGLCALGVLLLLIAGAVGGCAGSATASTTAAGSATTVVAVGVTTAGSSEGTVTTASSGTTSSTTTTLPPTTTEAPTTTTELTTTTTIPPDPKGWKRYTAGGISIVLPTSFKGGAPDSAALKAQTKTMVGGKTFVSETQGYYTDMDVTWLLGFMGKSSKTRWIPMVFVLQKEVPTDVSLKIFATSWVSRSTPAYTAEVLDASDSRMTYIISEPAEGSSPAGSRLTVFIRSGKSVYIVEYSGTKVAFAQFKDNYTQSAARLRLVVQG